MIGAQTGRFSAAQPNLSTLPRCGAQDWAYDDRDELIIYGTCGKAAGHEERFHQEWRDGKLWAEWSGPVETAPA